MNSNRNMAYNIDELSQELREKVVKEFMAYPNHDGSFNSLETVLIGLRSDNVLFDSYGIILQA